MSSATSACASSADIPVTSTRAPSSRTEATVRSTRTATADSSTGTPVTSITTTRGAVLADGAQQALVELLGALEVQRADHRQHQQPLLELQHGRGQLEDRLLLGALELREGGAQLPVGLAEAHAALLELRPRDLEGGGHRVERAGQRADLARARLRGPDALLAVGQPPRRIPDRPHGGDDGAREVQQRQRDGGQQRQEADPADHGGDASRRRSRRRRGCATWRRSSAT